MGFEISAKDAKASWSGDRKNIVLLDCRQHEELKIAKIDGACHIPMNEIPARLSELDPDKEIIVFCHHGVRSANVTAFLLQQDFPRVKSMRGGIEAWSLEVDGSVPRY